MGQGLLLHLKVVIHRNKKWKCLKSWHNKRNWRVEMSDGIDRYNILKWSKLLYNKWKSIKKWYKDESVWSIYTNNIMYQTLVKHKKAVELLYKKIDKHCYNKWIWLKILYSSIDAINESVSRINTINEHGSIHGYIYELR